MRLLFFVNLLLIVILAGALARTYQGTPLPWLAHRATTDVRPAAAPAAKEAPAQADAKPLPPKVSLPRPEAPTPASPAPGPAVLHLVTEGDYPPFNYRDEEGHLTGFDVEIAEALCQRMNRECRFETRPWLKLLPALSSGVADAAVSSILIPSPARETLPADKSIAFTTNYYSTPGQFAALKKKALTAASAAAMDGKSVAVQKGSIHEAFLAHRFPGVRIVALPTLGDAEAALADGQVDYLFADRNALLRWQMKGKAANCCRLVGGAYNDPAYFGSGAGIALRAGDKALRDDFEHALAAIVADGTYAEISSRYFGQSIR